MQFLLKRRLSYFDSFWFIMFALLLEQQKYAMAISVLFLGSFLSVLMKMFFLERKQT